MQRGKRILDSSSDILRERGGEGGEGIKQYFSLLDPSSTVLYELGSNRLTRDGVPVFCHVCP